MNSVLVGIGAALPKKCVLNSDLPAELNTSDEWIIQRTGIKQRYIAEQETTSSLATEAARNAINHAKLSNDDIDLIIVATVTGDYTFPSTASIVQRELNIKHGVAFDISAACSGFVYAIDIADAYIKNGKSKCALVIGAETFSKILDWTDRSTCVLFGDGAGAVIFQAQDTSDRGIQYCKTYTDGAYIDCLKTSGGVSTTQTSGFVQMDGREVFKFAIEKFFSSLKKLLVDNNMTVDDVDLLVPHQANTRIIEKLIEISGIKKEKVLITLGAHSNTSAASIPLALNEIRDKLFTKRNVILLSMGAGFTWGSVFIKL